MMMSFHSYDYVEELLLQIDLQNAAISSSTMT